MTTPRDDLLTCVGNVEAVAAQVDCFVHHTCLLSSIQYPCFSRDYSQQDSLQGFGKRMEDLESSPLEIAITNALPCCWLRYERIDFHQAPRPENRQQLTCLSMVPTRQSFSNTSGQRERPHSCPDIARSAIRYYQVSTSQLLPVVRIFPSSLGSHSRALPPSQTGFLGLCQPAIASYTLVHYHTNEPS